MSYEVWGEPDDGPELPDGWWDDDQVGGVVEAIKALSEETLYEGGDARAGVSVRFLARITHLRLRAGLMKDDDPLVMEALTMLGESS